MLGGPRGAGRWGAGRLPAAGPGPHAAAGRRGALNYLLTASNAPAGTGSPLWFPQGGRGGGAREGRGRKRRAGEAARVRPAAWPGSPCSQGCAGSSSSGGGRSKPVSVTMATSFPGYLRGRVLRERSKEQLEKRVAARIWAGGQGALRVAPPPEAPRSGNSEDQGLWEGQTWVSGSRSSGVAPETWASQAAA